MSYSLKIQRTIHAPVARVWEALTEPEIVKQYFFGTNLETSWKPGSTIYFRGEWEGKAYEDKGIVRKFVPGRMLQYTYFSSRSKLEDRQENYQTLTYRVRPSGNSTIVTLLQANIPSEEQKAHSAKNWTGVLKSLQKLLETT